MTNPRLAYWSPNGLPFDPATMHCTERKFRGWGAECAVHIENLLAMRPGKLIFHCPTGTKNPDNMEFDAYPNAIYGSPKLDYLCDRKEHLGALLTIHELLPEMEIVWYLGQFAASPHLSGAYAREEWREWERRTVKSLEPLNDLANRGVKVGVFVDAIANKSKDSHDAYGFSFIRKTYPSWTFGIETRPHTVADWANQADIHCVTEYGLWHRMNPDVYEDSRYAIPNGQLKGPQWLICQKPEDAQTTWDDGMNVAYIGRWTPAGAA